MMLRLADSQPFGVRFCDGVHENFQHHFVINIGYCTTEACITNIITIFITTVIMRDIFFDEIELIFLRTLLQSLT